MAQWKETLEPYIKVTERVKTVTLNPTAGESLIIGCVLISDAGPSTPTLISGQKEFLAAFASQDLSQAYVESLNSLYSGLDKTTAATMWENAYRLAGSNTMLVVRAMKANNINFTKPLNDSTVDTYIQKDGTLLKKISEFKIVKDEQVEKTGVTDTKSEGWNIAINGIGVFGNRTTDEGAQYDYYCKTLPDLVESLNDTNMFFSPKFTCYSGAECKTENEITDWRDNEAQKEKVVCVLFEEVYLGANFLDTTDPRCGIANTWIKCTTPSDKTTIKKWFTSEAELFAEPAPAVDTLWAVGNEATQTVTQCYKYTKFDNLGMLYLLTCTKDWKTATETQYVIDLNSEAYSKFIDPSYYALNVYNSASTLKVRIRRFNHDAVTSKEITDKGILTSTTSSPYNVLTTVLDTFTKPDSKDNTCIDSRRDSSMIVQARDFYEVAVWDPGVNSEETSFFNIGAITGRGDIEASEINNSLSMIQLVLPDVIHDINLNYYGYDKDDLYYETVDSIPSGKTAKDTLSGALKVLQDRLYAPTTGQAKLEEGDYVKFTNTEETTPAEKIYKVTKGGYTEIYQDLTIDPDEYSFLTISDSDLKKAVDLLVQDEVYTVEGLCDLGNTELSFQNYLANTAINDNYFYPISTINSTNYMAIGNAATKISQDSFKLYMSAPWDVDSGNLGWKYFASPSVLYWEAVARNRRNNREFAPLFGQINGIMLYQNPVTEFNKKSRQLLLSRKVNTNMWNTNTQAWNMNDNYTKQIENTIMNDEGNSRLGIRISKAMPSLLRQFIGKRITERLCTDVINVITYYFKSVILPMEYSVDDYQIFCNYDETLARQNKIKVTVNVRFQRALKYIEVYDNFFDVGMDITAEE